MKQEVILGDALDAVKKIHDECIDTIFCSPSPPSFERDEKMIGGEKCVSEYLDHLVGLFRECRRVLKKTGSLWVQMGSYHNNRKGGEEGGNGGDLLPTAESFVMTMVMEERWHLKSKLIWHRTNDLKYQEDYNRFARDWEHLFFFTKEQKGHYFNNPRKNRITSVIQAPYRPPKDNRFASGFPEKVIKYAIEHTCPPDGTVMDPLAGTGTTGLVARLMGRGFIMIEMSEDKYYGIRGRLA